MNKILSILFLNVFTIPLLAELNVDDYTTERMVVNDAKEEGEDQRPFSVSVDFHGTGKAKFEHKRCYDLDDVQFAMASLDASMVFYYNPQCKEGLLATTSYTYTRIKWDNPYFYQDHFDTVSLGIGAFTERADRWLWQAQVIMNADVDYFKASESLFWNILLSGRYAYNDCLGIHVGFIAFTGMKIDRVWPIIGFDWQINDVWKLNMVYPLNVALVYAWNNEWAFAVAGRAFDERHRVGKSKREAWDRGLLEYRATGVEGSIRYTSCNGRWQAELHAGEILGGRVKVSNRQHGRIHRFNFKTAPYVGGEVAAKF